MRLAFRRREKSRAARIVRQAAQRGRAILFLMRSSNVARAPLDKFRWRNRSNGIMTRRKEYARKDHQEKFDGVPK